MMRRDEACSAQRRCEKGCASSVYRKSDIVNFVVKMQTYALALLAVMKTFSMCRSWNRICSRMIAGFHTPDAVRAAPKAEPASV